MSSANTAARVKFCIRRSSALMRDITNKRQVHTSHPNVQRMAFDSPDVKENDLSKLNRQFHQVATDGLRTFVEKLTAKPKEARMWMKYFKKKAVWDEGQTFCVLHVTEEVFYNMKIFEIFTWSAAFLMQNKMKPVIVFGSQRRMKESMQDMENKMDFLGGRLQKLLQQHGVNSSLYTADKHLLRIGATGRLSIDVDGIKTCLLDNEIPIITNFVADETAKQKFRIYDPVSVAEIITKETKPMKLMFLSSEKGIRDDNGSVVSNIILPVGTRSKILDSWCQGDAKKKAQGFSKENAAVIDRIGLLLEKLPAESSVILTSADTVIQELFTHHGSGTMINRSEPVKRFESLDDVNKEELARLLSDSFKKPLPDSYLSSIRDKVDSVYVSDSYSAAVIILRDPDVKIPYMDKFAVRTSSQGIGLTTQIWAEVVKDYNQLFWRCKQTNDGALGWYNTVCQGSWKDRSWIVFWYGLQTCNEVFPLIDYALKRKETFDASLGAVPTNETKKEVEAKKVQETMEEEDAVVASGFSLASMIGGDARVAFGFHSYDRAMEEEPSFVLVDRGANQYHHGLTNPEP